jgi:hypothetical protein
MTHARPEVAGASERPHADQEDIDHDMQMEVQLFPRRQLAVELQRRLGLKLDR